MVTGGTLMRLGVGGKDGMAKWSALIRAKLDMVTHKRMSEAPVRIDGFFQTGWTYTGRSLRNENGDTSPGVPERFDMSVGRGGSL